LQVASLYGVLDLKDNLTPGLQKAQSGVSGLKGGMQKAGKDVAVFGAKLTALTAPLAGVGFYAARTAIQWESAFAGVIKTVDGTAEELAVLEQGLRDLATGRTGSPVAALKDAHTQLAGIAEVAGQLGVELPNILEFSETMGMLAMSTNLTAEQAAMLGAQFANITGMDMTDIDRWGAAIVHLGNTSATTEAAIAEMAQRISVAGSLAGMHEADILGLAAAISSLGFEPEAGGSAISSVLNDLTAWVSAGGSDELARIAEVAGLTADAFQELYQEDPMEAFLQFLEGLGQLDAGEQIATLEELGWTGLRLSPVLLSMAGSTALVRNSVDGANTAWEENNALVNEAGKRADTTEGKINELKNKTNDLAIKLGDALLPPLTEVVTKLGGLADAATEANPAIIPLIMGFGALAVVAGPLVTILGGVVSLLSLMVAPLALLGIILGTGIVANFGDLSANIRQVGDAIRDGDVVGALEGIVGALFDIPEGVAGAIGSIVGIDTTGGLQAWANVLSMIMAGFKWIIDNPAEAFKKLYFEVPGGLNDFLGVLQKIVGAMAWIIDNAPRIPGFLGGSETGSSVSTPLNAEDIARLAALTEPGSEGIRSQNTRTPGERDIGGRGEAGMPYLIGRGAQPELFVPDTAGTFYPRGQYAMAGAGGPIVVQLQLDRQTIYEAVVNEGRRRSEGWG
jgi:TP901 family phage tail tape measure protein